MRIRDSATAYPRYTNAGLPGVLIATASRCILIRVEWCWRGRRLRYEEGTVQRAAKRAAVGIQTRFGRAGKCYGEELGIRRMFF